MHAYIHNCMHTYIHMYIHMLYMHTYMHVYIHTYVHTCIHTYIIGLVPVARPWLPGSVTFIYKSLSFVHAEDQAFKALLSVTLLLSCSVLNDLTLSNMFLSLNFPVVWL